MKYHPLCVVDNSTTLRGVINFELHQIVGKLINETILFAVQLTFVINNEWVLMNESENSPHDAEGKFQLFWIKEKELLQNSASFDVSEATREKLGK